MTATQAAFFACTPNAVHGWLTSHNPDGRRRFDDEFRAALEAAATSHDHTPVDDLVRRWWTGIWGRTQRLNAEEVAQFRRLDLEGDTTGLHRHDTHQ